MHVMYCNQQCNYSGSNVWKSMNRYYAANEKQKRGYGYAGNGRSDSGY